MSVSETTTAIWKVIHPWLSHGVTALLGGAAAFVYFRKQKHHEFMIRRLDECYGPMLGLIKQVRANAEARFKVSQASGEAWPEICARHPQPFLDHDKYFEPFKKQIEYENKRFKREDLPAYDQILDLLKTKNRLSFPSTLQWFEMLTQYVDHWKRPMAAEVLMKLDISEEPLLKFYADVEEHCTTLKKHISGDKSG